MVALNLWGILCAVLSGATDACCALLQKRVVDRTPAEERANRFVGHLLRNPYWLVGQCLSLGPGTFFILTAQNLIGPALVPGLAATGLVLLAMGSVRLNGEKLSPAECLGIAMMVGGVSLLGLSNLSIPSRSVGLVEGALLARLTLFSIVLALCGLLGLLLARRVEGQRQGLLLALAAGFPYALMNAWTLPMLLTIGPVFTGQAGLRQGMVFAVSCVMLVSMNLAGIRTVQEAYKSAAASKVQPVLQIPVQTAPILLYFGVYQRSGAWPAALSIPMGVALILVGGFLLGKRVADLQGDGRQGEAAAQQVGESREMG